MINMYLNVIDYDAEIRKRICPGCPIYEDRRRKPRTSVVG
jgi:hypothetical protein